MLALESENQQMRENFQKKLRKKKLGNKYLYVIIKADWAVICLIYVYYVDMNWLRPGKHMGMNWE